MPRGPSVGRRHGSRVPKLGEKREEFAARFGGSQEDGSLRSLRISWNEPDGGDADRVRTLVKQLRRTLGDDPARPR